MIAMLQKRIFRFLKFLHAFHFSNPGFPGGSVVGFAPDEDGRPLFVFSGMSSHTQGKAK